MRCPGWHGRLPELAVAGPVPSVLADLVDREAARSLLGLVDDRDDAWWTVPGGRLPGFWVRRLHQLGARAGWVVPFHRTALRRTPGAERLVLVRVDDYPRWDRPLEEFLLFDAL